MPSYSTHWMGLNTTPSCDSWMFMLKHDPYLSRLGLPLKVPLMPPIFRGIMLRRRLAGLHDGRRRWTFLPFMAPCLSHRRAWPPRAPVTHEASPQPLRHQSTFALEVQFDDFWNHPSKEYIIDSFSGHPKTILNIVF